MCPVICVCMCRNTEVLTQPRRSRDQDQEKLLKRLITDESYDFKRSKGFFL